MNDIVLSARACIRRKRDLVEPAAIDLRFWAGNNNKTTFNLTTITFVMFIVAMPPLSPGGPTQFAFPVLLCLGASCPPGAPFPLQTKRYPPVVLSFFQKGKFQVLLKRNNIVWHGGQTHDAISSWCTR